MNSKFKIALAVVAGVALGVAATQGLRAQAKPPAYVITEIEVINQDAYKEFLPKVAEWNRTADAGKYLVRSDKIVAIEGQPPRRLTLQVYDSLEKAQVARSSAAWKELVPLREKAVKTRSYVVEGLAN